MKFLRIVALVLLVALPAVILISGPGLLVSGEDEIVPDVVEGEEDAEATVESDEGDVVDEGGSERDGSEAVKTGSESEAEEEEAEKLVKPSPDAETTIAFIRPAHSTDLPAGVPVRILVGFYNKGSKNFVVESMDAAFHYPQDYSYYIQNFTAFRYSHTVEPSREATFDYGFTPSEAFGSRPFGLQVNLNYRDDDGNIFQDAVFNATINIIELDEGLDGETFFLYVFLLAVVVLLAVGGFQLLSSSKKKFITSSRPRAQIETGTQSNKTDVDYDWLPKETLDALNKSPGRSPKSRTSPRLRAAAANKRRTGADD